MRAKTAANAFQGKRFYSTSFSTRGRARKCSRSGVVVRGGLPRARLEVRTVNRPSPEALGEDGDVTGFSYVGAMNRLNACCSHVALNAGSLRCAGAQGQALVRAVSSIQE